MKALWDVLRTGIIVEAIAVLCLLPLAAAAPAISLAGNLATPDIAPPASPAPLADEGTPAPVIAHPPQAASQPSAPSAIVPAPATKIVRMRVTAYCACEKCCGEWADGITASGRPVTHNGGKFVAAPPAIAYGTMVRIPGYAAGESVPVIDRGGSITSGRLDVYFPSHTQALRWGVKMLDVEILSADPTR